MSQHDITKFTIHQFKGIRGTVEIHPDGPGCIIIAGPNGAGKSSVVDGIQQLVAPAGIKGIPKPIHEGASEAYVEMETTEIRARRTYKDSAPAGKLDVFALDGAKYASGAQFMTEVTGGQIFDTAQFMGMADKDQRAELLRHVDLPFVLDEIDGKRKGFFDARTDVGRDVGKLEAQLAGYAAADPSIPGEEVSAAAILAEHEQARQHNASIDRQLDGLASIQGEIERAIANVTRLVDELDAARTYLLNAQETEKDLRAKFEATERIDTDAISARLATVEETNAKIRAQQHRAAVAAELADKTAEHGALAAKLKAIDKVKSEGLAAAAFPVPGLSVDETGITHNSIPFKQINAAMQIIVAFDLFTQGKPDLRLIFIKNGDLLDADSLGGIEEIAVARGYYVIVERDRDQSRQMGITVRDGQVAA